MELKDYIKSVLTQISDAVKENNGDGNHTELNVNPFISSSQFVGNEMYVEDEISHQFRKLINVEFDVTLEMMCEIGTIKL